MSGDAPESGRRLRIALLAHHLRAGGGIVVGRSLLSNFHRLGPEHHYFITVPDLPEYREVTALFPSAEVVVFRPSGGPIRRLFYEKREIAKRVCVFRPDVLFGMGGIGLNNPPCPQMLFVQDAHYFYPTRYYAMETAKRKLVKQFHKWTLGRQLKRTNLLICHTPVARDRLRQTFGYRGPMRISPNGITGFPPRTGDTRAAADRLRGHENAYKLFYLTKYYPHKNIEGIVEMFTRFADALADVILVITIAPEQHERAPRLMAMIEERGLTDRIINVGPLSHGELAAYYEYCDALLMPTFLESFGIPYLEAMHFRMPILTSDLDFARGVCQDAALFFDPWDPAAMKDAVLRLKSDPALAEQLVAAGERRLAAGFRGWDAIAADMLEWMVSLARTGEVRGGEGAEESR